LAASRDERRPTLLFSEPLNLRSNKWKSKTMGLFNNLMSKIFGHASATAAPPTQTQSTPGAPQQAQAPAAPAATVTAPPVVDVTAILNDLAKKNPEKLDWKRSIV